MATLKWTGPAAYVSLLNSIRAFRSDLFGLDPCLAPDELEALVIRQDTLALDFTRTVLYTSHWDMISIDQTPPTELNALIKTWSLSFAAGSLYAASLQEYKASDGYSLWCDETVCVTAENEKSGITPGYFMPTAEKRLKIWAAKSTASKIDFMLLRASLTRVQEHKKLCIAIVRAMAFQLRSCELKLTHHSETKATSVVLATTPPKRSRDEQNSSQANKKQC